MTDFFQGLIFGAALTLLVSWLVHELMLLRQALKERRRWVRLAHCRRSAVFNSDLNRGIWTVILQGRDVELLEDLAQLALQSLDVEGQAGQCVEFDALRVAQLKSFAERIKQF